MTWQVKVKQLMAAKGMNQKQLSQLSGITEASVSRYLKGERTARLDIIVNFDLDVLFFNTIQYLVDKCKPNRVYGVSERKNRDRWMSNLQLNDIIPNQVYINTGLVVYGAETIAPDLIEQYESFLHEFSKHIYCPEQDFVNHHFGNVIQEIPAHFNLMFTDERYTQLAPVMVHFLGADKPWTDHSYNDFYTRYYFKRYLLECKRNKQYISSIFNQKVTEKVDNS